MPVAMLNQAYIICAAVGSIFLIICAFMGAHHGGARMGHSGAGGHGGLGQAGHTGIGHSGASGHAAIGHNAATGHSGTTGHSAAGHSASGTAHSGTAGHGQANTGTNSGANELVQSAQFQARSGPFHAPTREEETGPFEKLLAFLNPTIITTFLAFFGLTGMICMIEFPLLGYVTLLPASIGGAIAVKIVTKLMDMFLANSFSSSAATEHDLIGHMAEVSVPISGGKTGEITYIVSSKRLTAPARAKDPTMEFKRGTKVIVTDHLANYALVDLWTDSFLDPAFDYQTLTPEEKLAKIRAEQTQYEQ
ncbi:MAG TPA: hypothetical protein V6C76_09735 [Drouetiella sp.]